MSHSHNGNTLTALITMLPIWAIAIIASLSFSECNQSDSVPIPRPTSYPRIQLCDTIYSPISNFPLNIETNSQAITKIKSRPATDPSTQWIDIFYPTYNATIYCTLSFTDKEAVKSIINNRLERFSLETTNRQAQTTTINHLKHNAEIITCRDNIVTPVMFITTDNNHWVLSGTLNFAPDRTINYDSVAPIITAVKHDILHIINNISPNNER